MGEVTMKVTGPVACARLFLRRGNPMWLPSPGRTRRSAPTHPAWIGATRQLGALIQAEHTPVAVGVHLDRQVNGHAELQLSEEVHHAGVAREHLEHHLVVANVAPAASIVQDRKSTRLSSSH